MTEATTYYNLTQEFIPLLEQYIAFAIADRDAFYDECTDDEGNVSDEYDARELKRVDDLIDRGRNLLPRLKAAQIRMERTTHERTTGTS